MTSLLSSDVVVGGRSFRLQKIPALRASELFNRLMRLAVPSVAQIAGGLSAGKHLRDFFNQDVSSLSSLGPAASTFFTTFTVSEQTQLFKDMFEGTRWKSDKGEWLELIPLIDECFTGKVADMYLLLGEAIKFQFGDFKDAFKAAVNAFNAKAAVLTNQIPTA